MEPQIPESIVQHQPKYHDGAWKNYTLAELGSIVHFFIKRSSHRSDAAKKAKDIEDAQNYLNMMQAHIDAAK